MKRTGRAMVDALTAIDADNVRHRHLVESGNMRLSAAVEDVVNADFLKVDTGSDATATEDALVHIADNRGAGVIALKPRFGRVTEAVEVNAVLTG